MHTNLGNGYNLDVLSGADMSDPLNQILQVSLKHTSGAFILMEVNQYNKTYGFLSGHTADVGLRPAVEHQPLQLEKSS